MAPDLTEWAEHYLRARDAFEKKLVSLDRNSTGLNAVYKHKKLQVLAMLKLSADNLPKEGFVNVVTLQTEENLTVLLKNFEAFAKNPDLTILFVNPKLNEKWMLKPAVHGAVADKSSLKAGLTTLFQTVPTV